MSYNGQQQKFDVAVTGATTQSAYAGVMAAVGRMKTKKVSENAAVHMVNFETKATLRMAGQRWMVQVVDQAGTPHIVVTATPMGITGLAYADAKIASLAHDLFSVATSHALAA